jgi:hypothetical protein
MSHVAVPFPEHQPSGYHWLEDEPKFDPKIHLCLEKPQSLLYLTELGYDEEIISSKATPVAASSPFRVLSDEGARVLLHVARNLRSKAIGCERIENMVRGGCYRSRFLRDVCIDTSVTDLMCEIYGVDVAPHTMPVHLGHMNYAPEELERAVDKWHHDTLPLDYVMMVTDPSTLHGGQFEYFLGTKSDMKKLADAGKKPSVDRIVAPNFPGPGYAIALHGDMVVHRGAALTQAGERVTMVNGYVSMDTRTDDQHRHIDLTVVDDAACLYTEWAKHSAWRARDRLDRLIEQMNFSSDRLGIADALDHAIEDVQQAVRDMRDTGEHKMHHYE